MFPGQECEIHMDNARAHLRSSDFNPADRTHSKATLLEKALAALEGAEEVEEVRGSILEASKPDLARYLKCVSGHRTPEIFKIAREYGNVVERTPPYHPELQPIELVWSHMKANYSRRYDDCSVAPFLGTFFRDVPESELVATVCHTDKVAARMAEPQEALIIDDDMAAPLIGKSPA